MLNSYNFYPAEKSKPCMIDHENETDELPKRNVNPLQNY